MSATETQNLQSIKRRTCYRQTGRFRNHEVNYLNDGRLNAL